MLLNIKLRHPVLFSITSTLKSAVSAIFRSICCVTSKIITPKGLTEASSVKPFDSFGIPTELKGIPVASVGLPFCLSGIPFKATVKSFLLKGIPFASVGLPFYSAGIPFNASVIPDEALGISFY